MPVNTKAIQRRIKSVKNTRKITKAMEMVAAAKMRKAVQAAIDTRVYAGLAWNLLVNLSQQEVAIPLLEVRPVRQLLVILITSNRGLCGSFNSNIIKKTAKQLIDPKNIGRQRVKGKLVEPSEKLEVDVIGVGKKGAQFAKKMGYNLVSSFTDISDTPTINDALIISKLAISQYENKKYDKVVIAYTDFQSSINQVAKLRQVLPVSQIDLEKMMSELGPEVALNGSQNVTLAKFNLYSNDESLEIKQMKIAIKYINSALTGNITVKDADTGETYLSISADSSGLQTTKTVTANTNLTSQNLLSFINIKKGKIKKIEVTGTLLNRGGSDNYTIYVGAFYAKRVTTIDYHTLPNKSNVYAGNTTAVVDVDLTATTELTAITELNDYLFEPNRTEVLKIILPRLVETQIYQSMLESSASEHSSRMLAMRNASDAATDMIDELNLNYNKARQAAITQEISEIVGGAAALE